MKHLLSAASVVLLGAVPAKADAVCEMSGMETVPAFEAVKAEFLDGDFDRFLILATEIMAQKRDGLKANMTQLKGLFPDGFESCHTI